MIVKVDWTNGVTSTFTNIRPAYSRFDQRVVLLSNDGETTRDINIDKVNYIAFTTEPGDKPKSQPSPYST